MIIQSQIVKPNTSKYIDVFTLRRIFHVFREKPSAKTHKDSRSVATRSRIRTYQESPVTEATCITIVT